MKVRAIVQARTGSTRLPGKVLADINGKPLLAYVIERAAQISGLDGPPIVATTHLQSDDAIAELAGRMKVACYRGSDRDVLDRYYFCSLFYNLDAVLRITGDSPLLSPEANSLLVADWRHDPCDWLGSKHGDGVIHEIISVAALKDAHIHSAEREHVITWTQQYGNIRYFDLSVDYPADLERVRKLA